MLSKEESNTIFESLVWFNQGLNSGLPDHWQTCDPLSQWPGLILIFNMVHCITLILVGEGVWHFIIWDWDPSLMQYRLKMKTWSVFYLTISNNQLLWCLCCCVQLWWAGEDPSPITSLLPWIIWRPYFQVSTHTPYSGPPRTKVFWKIIPLSSKSWPC